jgi:tripartite-type tricarboxylate transporter receptor subunit TctC
MKRRQALLSITALMAAVSTRVDAASAWPGRAITYIVPFAAGGASDALARLVMQRLAPVLGVPIVVENKAGAGGGLGSELLARAPADGYTVGGGTISSHAINVSLYPKIGYDPIKSFTPIAMFGSNPLVLAVGKESRFTSFAQVLEAVRKAPSSVSSASSGYGSSTHMCLELLSVQAGAKFNHIPYKGSGPAIPDVISGQVDMMFDPTVTMVPQVQSGSLRALAVTSAKRLTSLPDVPTVGEFVRGFEVLSWQAMFAPAATPAPVAKRLHDEVTKIIRSAEVQEKLVQLGMIQSDMNVAQITAFQTAEVQRWAGVVKAANLKIN